MRLAIITINKNGQNLAKRLKSDFKNAKIFNWQLKKKESLRDLVRDIFNEYEGLIFITALGITARTIAPFIKNKLNDPAVVAVDTAARFSISVLSGHEGGANKLAYLVAGSLDCLAVITTGTEVHKKFILGIGARRGIEADKVKIAIKKAISKADIKLKSIRIASTLDIKKNEDGLIKACADLNLPLVFISKNKIKNFKADISSSAIVKSYIGIDGVSEPCALLAGRRTRLVLKKQKQNGVTVAIAKES